MLSDKFMMMRILTRAEYEKPKASLRDSQGEPAHVFKSPKTLTLWEQRGRNATSEMDLAFRLGDMEEVSTPPRSRQVCLNHMISKR